VQLVEQRTDTQFGRDLASIVDVAGGGRRAEAS
jgi:hypothetical protein